jgi:hypothetical protein
MKAEGYHAMKADIERKLKGFKKASTSSSYRCNVGLDASVTSLGASVNMSWRGRLGDQSSSIWRRRRGNTQGRENSRSNSGDLFITFLHTKLGMVHNILTLAIELEGCTISGDSSCGNGRGSSGSRLGNLGRSRIRGKTACRLARLAPLGFLKLELVGVDHTGIMWVRTVT